MEKDSIIAKEENLTKIKAREKIEIKINCERLNKSEGKIISDKWTTLPHNITMRRNMA